MSDSESDHSAQVSSAGSNYEDDDDDVEIVASAASNLQPFRFEPVAAPRQPQPSGAAAAGAPLPQPRVGNTDW